MGCGSGRLRHGAAERAGSEALLSSCPCERILADGRGCRDGICDLVLGELVLLKRRELVGIDCGHSSVVVSSGDTAADCTELCVAGLSWNGIRAALGTAGMDWVASEWVAINWMALWWQGSDSTALDRAGLD